MTKNRRERTILAVLVGLLTLGAATACGGDSANPTPAATATSGALSGAGSQVTRTVAPTATLPLATPTRPATPTAAPATAVLPTPVVSGFPVIPLPDVSPQREIVDLINRNGPAYSAAIERLDESLLAGVFTGDALDTYTKEVQAARQRGEHSQNALLQIQLVSIDVTGTTANVKTSERWRFQLGNSCTVYGYDEFYQAALIGGQWMVTRNQFVQTAKSAC